MQCPDPPVMIKTVEELQTLVDYLKTCSIVAVDTESDSLFSYYPKVCLIQISTVENEQIQDFIIDPLVIEDMHALGEIFVDPEIEIIFHAAEYDISILKRDFGFEIQNLFDTYMAARSLGWRRVGLASLLEELFDVKLDKRYQQADWARRPLPAEQLCYAQMDTHHLIELRNLLHADLIRKNLLEEAQEYFGALCAVDAAAESSFDAEGFWRMRDVRDMNGTQVRTLRELYLWRDQKARERDCPPFKIMQDAELSAIAMSHPQSYSELRNLRRVSRKNADRYGRAILNVVAAATHKPIPEPPAPLVRPEYDVLNRYDALHRWRKEKAIERGVESDIILSKQALWELAHHSPSSYQELAALDVIGPYRRQKYADEILTVLAELERQNQ